MCPIVHSGAVSFLSSYAFRSSLASVSPITFDNTDKIPRMLTKNSDHRKMVFGVKQAPAYFANTFLFQLVATGILTFEWTDDSKKVCCVVSKNADGKYKYKNKVTWNGFEFREAEHGGRLVSFKSIKAHGNIRNFLA